jgi:hypothetical protein
MGKAMGKSAVEVRKGYPGIVSVTRVEVFCPDECLAGWWMVGGISWKFMDNSCSYGHLSVISTYNPIYRMYNPIYNQL